MDFFTFDEGDEKKKKKKEGKIQMVSKYNSHRHYIQELMKKNKTGCFDCGESDSRWCSISHGTWICIRCAGNHRCLGTHISMVRSACLDSWNEKQYNLMLLGGNERAEKFFREKEILNFAFQAKYQSEESREYRMKLREEVMKKIGR